MLLVCFQYGYQTQSSFHTITVLIEKLLYPYNALLICTPVLLLKLFENHALKPVSISCRYYHALGFYILHLTCKDGLRNAVFLRYIAHVHLASVIALWTFEQLDALSGVFTRRIIASNNRNTKSGILFQFRRIKVMVVCTKVTSTW